jgi:magnesium transporter
VRAAPAGDRGDHRDLVSAPDDFKAHDTAHGHLVTQVPIGRDSERIGSVLASLTGQIFDSVDTVYVVDDAGGLLGFVPLTQLLVTPHDRLLRDVISFRPPAVSPEEDQERVVGLAIEHRLTAVPVVDKIGRLLGVVPPQALMAILRHEHIEDLHRIAGIQHQTANALHAIEAPAMQRVRDRLPWLLVAFVGSFIATYVMSRFEQILEARLVVAFFVPGIVYLADSIGTQTEVIAVRGLSLSRASLRDLLSGELRTALLVGALLGLLSFPVVFFAFRDPWLGLAVAMAILMGGMAATAVGLLFPWMLSYMGQDPAFGTGPLATIAQDLLSLLVYFMAVRLLL